MVESTMTATFNPMVTISPYGEVFISMLTWSDVAIKYPVLEMDRHKLIEMVWEALASLALLGVED